MDIINKAELTQTRAQNFKIVWDHFIVNEEPFSVLDHSDINDPHKTPNGCLYNGPNGARCAFGVLLTDEELKQIKLRNLEGQGAKAVIEKLNLERFTFVWKDSLGEEFVHSDPFYGELQSTHDDCAHGQDYKYMKTALIDLADAYQLDLASLDIDVGIQL